MILDTDVYDSLPEPEDDENDMLDMAFGLTDTSVTFQIFITLSPDAEIVDHALGARSS